jgi:hypothetical protein
MCTRKTPIQDRRVTGVDALTSQTRAVYALSISPNGTGTRPYTRKYTGTVHCWKAAESRTASLGIVSLAIDKTETGIP